MKRILAATLAVTATLAPALQLHAHEVAKFDDFTYSGKSLEHVTLKPGEYRNPILEGFYPDPSVLRVGDDYYLVLSSFAFYPGLPIFHSKDLVHWTQIGNAINRPGQLDFTGRKVSDAVFAPDISYHDGLFYIVNTCVRCKGNFVITAKNPAGPWSDPIWLPFEGIDPSIYWEGDKAYIVNNRAPDEPPRYDGHRAIWIQQFDWRKGKMIGPSTQIVNGGVDITKQPVWIEGPHIFKKDGWYYLSAAEGGTSVNHSQVIFRSRNLRGPFVPWAGNPILTQRDLDPQRPHPITSAGHAKLIQTQNGAWWATFLAVRPYEGDYYNTGRETFLLPVTWKDGWPVILPHGQSIPLAVRKPDLPQQPPPKLPTSGNFSYVDNFNGDNLAMQWIGVRIPKQPFYKIAKGELILSSRAPLGDTDGVPAFVGRRQQHAVANVGTTVRFNPAQDGDRAGLAAVQSDQSYLFFGLTRIDGKPMVALYTRNKGAEKLVASALWTQSGPLTLSIKVDGARMAFDYGSGKTATRTLASGIDARFLSTHEAGGFTGTVLGPYTWSH